MKKAAKLFIWMMGIFAVLYVALCTYFYFAQESLIFPGTPVTKNYQYKFPIAYKEVYIKAPGGDTLNGLFFKAKHSKGLLFYLHGNTGNVQRWSSGVAHYVNLGYDAFVLDYPGYGKSSGHITSQQKLFIDIKTAYDTVRKNYPESQVVILGYSIGTGPAAWLAAQSHPKMLILLAPYYSLTDISFKTHPYLPHFILKYPINTYLYLQHTTARIVIFHGDLDQKIYCGSSYKLKPYLKSTDKLIILKGQTHNYFDYNPVFEKDLKKLL
jgi:alpha-beta hydrolase superfamily lysophospholipase